MSSRVYPNESLLALNLRRCRNSPLLSGILASSMVGESPRLGFGPSEFVKVNEASGSQAAGW